VVIARVRDGRLSEIWFRPHGQAAFDEFLA
jgi:hypothetical protein